jgi:hypothetical protein
VFETVGALRDEALQAELWIRISLMRIRMRIRILIFDVMRIRIQNLASKRKAQTLEKVLAQAHIPYICIDICKMMWIQIKPINFDADPDFYFMGIRMRIQVTGQLERGVPELRHEEADRLGEEALHELVRHALQVPEPGGQKVQQLERHVKVNEG